MRGGAWVRLELELPFVSICAPTLSRFASGEGLVSFFTRASAPVSPPSCPSLPPRRPHWAASQTYAVLPRLRTSAYPTLGSRLAYAPGSPRARAARSEVSGTGFSCCGGRGGGQAGPEQQGCCRPPALARTESYCSNLGRGPAFLIAAPAGTAPWVPPRGCKLPVGTEPHPRPPAPASRLLALSLDAV